MAVTPAGWAGRPAPALPAAARRCRPGDAGAGILHLGLGAFHRAHQAVYTEEAIAAPAATGASSRVAPRSPTWSARCASRTTCSAWPRSRRRASATRVVGVAGRRRHAAERAGRGGALLADPAIRVVTLTVTEKAYRLDPATGRLRRTTSCAPT